MIIIWPSLSSSDILLTICAAISSGVGGRGVAVAVGNDGVLEASPYGRLHPARSEMSAATRTTVAGRERERGSRASRMSSNLHSAAHQGQGSWVTKTNWRAGPDFTVKRAQGEAFCAPNRTNRRLCGL